MNNPTSTTKAKESGACDGATPGDPAAAEGSPTSRCNAPYEMPKKTPTIADLLATRVESVSTLDEALAVLRSIHVFRTILDDVADPLKVKIGKEGCPDEVFVAGLGVLIELEERDRQLLDLERRVKAVRLGARRMAAPRTQLQGEGQRNVETPARQPVSVARLPPSRPPAGDAPVGGADAEAPSTSPGGSDVAAA